MRKLLIVQVAALGPEEAPGGWRRMRSAFPAVTCTVQGSVRTASPASEHGMVANGLYFRDLRKALFWEQSSALVEGPRIWEGFRARGGKVGMMFWQQILGEAVDFVVSPAPIHKHSGGMIQDCYTQPAELQARLDERVGRRFNLMNYWGPLASRKSTEWIVAATRAVMSHEAPDVLCTYLPHLDYDLQRHGPGSGPANAARMEMHSWLQELREAAGACGYEVVIYGDYSIERVTRGACFPNRALAEAGLFQTREIRGMRYPDFHASRAIALVDHAVAHVYMREEADVERVREVLVQVPGVEQVMGRGEMAAAGVAHPRGGELMLVAEPGAWFAYSWWESDREAPDFATHVDIHNKPGFDPCELFFGWPPLSVSRDTTRVRGTHGRVCEVAWDASVDLGEPADHVAFGSAIRDWLEGAR